MQSDAGAICYLTNEQTVLLAGVQLKARSILVVCSGAMEVMKPEGISQCASGGALLLRDCESFNLRVSAQSQLAVLQFDRPLARQPNSADLSEASVLVQNFLHQARFFASHDCAIQTLSQLVQAVRDVIESVKIRPSQRIRPSLDMRVRKALEMIDGSRHWQFKLSELASAAGASERNLYYLMRAETGMTPYGYYQRSRLLRARERMVDCRQRAPTISWLATNEGFTHLGRFSALYKQHFGELPSDTLDWINTVRNSVANSRDSVIPLSRKNAVY